MAFSSMFQKPNAKKNTKIHQNHQPPLEKSLVSFRIPSRSHPQPHSPQGHIPRFESPSFSLSWAHPSAVVAQRNASRLAVNPGPSGGLPRPPATVHHPFRLGLGLLFGSPKNLSNLNSKLSNFPTCQRVKILLPTGALIDIWHIWLTKLDDVKLRTSNKTAGKFMAGLSSSNSLQPNGGGLPVLPHVQHPISKSGVRSNPMNLTPFNLKKQRHT